MPPNSADVTKFDNATGVGSRTDPGPAETLNCLQGFTFLVIRVELPGFKRMQPAIMRMQPITL